MLGAWISQVSSGQKKPRSLLERSSVRAAMIPQTSEKQEISFQPNGYYDENTNIKDVDQYVKEYYREKPSQIPALEKQIQEKQHYLDTNRLSVAERSWVQKEIQQLEKKKDELISKQPFVEYEEKVRPIMEEWNSLISETGPYIRFGEEQKFCPDKLTLIRNFIQIASEYAPINLTMKSVNKPDQCPTCRKPYVYNDDDKIICDECGIYQDSLINCSDYSDLGRLNTGGGNDYNNQETFIKAMVNYQGKQETDFPPGAFEEFTMYCQGYRIKMENLSQETTRPIFKKLGYRDSYEDINLFLFLLIKKPLHNISEYEAILLQDYDLFSQKYNEIKGSERDSALGAQYVLFILMRRRKIPCRKENFRLPDTPSIRMANDKMARRVFEALNWIFEDTI